MFAAERRSRFLLDRGRDLPTRKTMRAFSSEAKTIVCKASKGTDRNQGVARCKNLFPNEEQTQQRMAALTVLLGYDRVSKADDQDTGPQIEALKAAGCPISASPGALMV